MKRETWLYIGAAGLAAFALWRLWRAIATKERAAEIRANQEASESADWFEIELRRANETRGG